MPDPFILESCPLKFSIGLCPRITTVKIILYNRFRNDRVFISQSSKLSRKEMPFQFNLKMTRYAFYIDLIRVEPGFPC